MESHCDTPPSGPAVITVGLSPDLRRGHSAPLYPERQRTQGAHSCRSECVTAPGAGRLLRFAMSPRAGPGVAVSRDRGPGLCVAPPILCVSVCFSIFFNCCVSARRCPSRWRPRRRQTHEKNTMPCSGSIGSGVDEERS